MRINKLQYILILPLIFLASWALSWGLSDVFSYQALRFERSWLKKNTIKDIDEWNKAKYWAKLASTFNGSNPDHSEMLGRLYYWRFFVEGSPVTSFEEGGQYLNQGLIQLRSAIEKRPTWPLTWARLIKLKSIAGNLDDEYWYAWDKAQALGRWETFVQEELLKSGLLHWSEITPQQRTKVVSVVSDMISKRYSERTAVGLVGFYDRSVEVCLLLPAKILDASMHMSRRCP